jgi:hypothetical protein
VISLLFYFLNIYAALDRYQGQFAIVAIVHFCAISYDMVMQRILHEVIKDPLNTVQFSDISWSADIIPNAKHEEIHSKV